MKRINLIVLLTLLVFTTVKAQDAILISEGNFVRGVIKGTNYSSVAIEKDDQTVVQFLAKDIESFIWNGETYVSKPIIVKKRAESRFFRLLESGVVNLYAIGNKAVTTQVVQPRVKVRPTFGVGLGSGGGVGGVGGGISIGRGNTGTTDKQVDYGSGKVSFFIEKPGTGPMQEISLENTAALKSLLLQKLNNDEDLAERIKATDSFNDKILVAFIKAYNEMKK